MKNLILLSVFLACSCVAALHNESPYATQVQGIIENTINSTINKILGNLTDPIRISPVTMDFGEGEALSGGLNLTNFMVVGVKDSAAKAIKVNILTSAFSASFVWSEVTFLLKYWADVVLLNLIPFYGHGRMSISFDEIEVNIQGTAHLKDNPKIKDIVLLITVKLATFDLNGLLDHIEYSSLVSNALTDNFADFVTDNAQLISEVISPIVESFINSHLDANSQVRVRGVEIFVK